jgi:hypothetical protein
MLSVEEVGHRGDGERVDGPALQGELGLWLQMVGETGHGAGRRGQREEHEQRQDQAHRRQDVGERLHA